MCSRYEVPEDKEIARHFDVKLKLPKDFKRIIYPGYQAPILLDGAKGRVAETRFWGFILRIPGKKDPSKLLEKIMQNAVSETVDEKRTFKPAWDKNQRCVIPVRTFFEPKDKKFLPIHDPKLPMLSIAGIYTNITYKGEPQAAFTMLTCEPNSFMEDFHDRMPVILKPDDVDEWLSPDTPADQAKKLCRPYSGQLKFFE